MTTIVTRAGKGSALTLTEADANFTNLNNDKLERNGGYTLGPIGLGAAPTPSWNASYYPLQTGRGVLLGAGGTQLMENVYVSTVNSSWRYMYSGQASMYSQSSGFHRWYSSGSGAANAVAPLPLVMEIGEDKILSVQGGVKFPAANSDPAVLDAYVEGTFTPAVAGATSSGTATYSIREGRYTRIGNVVHVSVRVFWTGHSGSGALTISGLPISPASMTPLSVHVNSTTGMTLPAGSLSGVVLVNAPLGGNVILVAGQTSGGVSQYMATQPAGEILISGSYQAG